MGDCIPYFYSITVVLKSALSLSLWYILKPDISVQSGSKPLLWGHFFFSTQIWHEGCLFLSILFLLIFRNHFPPSEKNICLFKNQDYEKCIKFCVHYSKKAIQFSLCSIWLYASKIFSKSKLNSGKIDLKLVATEVTQTIKWTGRYSPVQDGKPTSPAKVSVKKSYGKK